MSVTVLDPSDAPYVLCLELMTPEGREEELRFCRKLEGKPTLDETWRAQYRHRREVCERVIAMMEGGDHVSA